MSVTTAAWSEGVDAVVTRLKTRLDPVASAGRAPPARSDFDLSHRGVTGAPLVPAAVLAPLIERDGVLWFILTERSAHLKRHAGQISFPGGAPDAGDDSLAATALREAHEEIGLPPHEVELLGAFEPYETITGFAITPFVGLVRAAFTPTPDPLEVASVFEAPFAFLMDPANHHRACREAGGVTRWFYETPYDGRRIWGATAGLLKLLSDRLYGGAS
jgi:8-oxo-dGTP pyrophosphatase MutT (NUDIX family)